MTAAPEARHGAGSVCMSPLPIVPSLERDQYGVLTRGQALASGFSAYRIRRLLAEGRWVVVLGSVYAVHSAPLSEVSLAWAAALGAGTEAIVSHITAARLWDYVVPPDPEVQVIVPRDRRLRIAGMRGHRIEISDSEVSRVAGVVCTSRLRTAIDCLLWLPEEAGRGLMVDALRRRRLGAEEARAVLARTPQRLVVEIDGRTCHSDDDAFHRDRTRQNRLLRSGYAVLRFTRDDLVNRPGHVVREVRLMLARTRQRGYAG